MEGRARGYCPQAQIRKKNSLEISHVRYRWLGEKYDGIHFIVNPTKENMYAMGFLYSFIFNFVLICFYLY